MEQQNLGPGIDSQEKVAGALSYVAFFAPWLLKKHTEFTAFHMKQAFAIQITALLLYAILSFLWGFVFLAQVILSVFLGLNAYQGKKEVIAGITDKMLDILVKLGIDGWFTPKNKTK